MPASVQLESHEIFEKIEGEVLRVQDLESMILKGHLLVEAQIIATLHSCLGPEVERARLTFYQKLEIVCCFFPWSRVSEQSIGPRTPHKNWTELNKIRNRIAHNLSPDNLRQQVADWVSETLGYRLKTISRTQVLRRNFAKALAFELAYFAGRTHEATRARRRQHETNADPTAC